MSTVGLGYTQITSLATAVGIGSIPPGTTYALIQVETQAVRYTDNGTTPTSSVGTKLSIGDILVYDAYLPTLKFIEITSGAVLNITFYRNDL